MGESSERWTIGPEVDGEIDVLVFSEDEDAYWEAVSAFRELYGSEWFLVDEGHFGEHSHFVTYVRAEDD